LSRYPHLVALRAAQRQAQQEISRSRVRERDPSDPRILLQRALGFAEQEAFAESLACFEQLLARAPDNAQAHCGHARLLQTLGNHAGARSALLSALMVQPEQGEALALLARSLVHLGDPQQAEECLNRSLRLVPTNAEARFEMGELLLAEDRPEAALEHLERATRLEPAFARCWATLGRCLFQLGHGSAAVDCLERARELAPSDPVVARAWGRSLLASGAASDVYSRFEKLLLDPKTCSVGLGLCCTVLAEEPSLSELYDLMGVETLLETFEVDAAPGYDTLEIFNEALVAAVDAQSEFGSGGVRRSGNLLPRCKGAVQALEQLFDDALTNYLARLPPSGHPFVEHRPLRCMLNAHALGMPPGTGERSQSDGSWLSGVYYAKVPAQPCSVSLGLLNAHASLAKSPRLTVQPRPGLLVLYPSFWHRESRIEHGADGLVTVELSVAARTGITGNRYAG